MLSGIFVIKVRNLLRRSGFFFVISLATWTLWSLISGLSSLYNFGLLSPYIINPAMLVLGATSGLYLRQYWRRGELFQLAIVIIVITAVALPIYANASAAVGGLFIAVAGLAALDLRQLAEPQQIGQYHPHGPVSEVRILRMTIVLALVAGVGVWLVLESQAALGLTALVTLVIAWVFWKSSAPSQWIPISLGLLLTAGAGATVIWLGSRDSWPSWLAESESLSSARHTLWADALGLWATDPLLGAGPGAFTPSSELATSEPSLAAVHSLVLQVGAELGIVGVILLASVFLGGLLFAARGSRPVALIAITAWTALAIHSSIDHLEDFPIVAFMAGVILAWSGFSGSSSLRSIQGQSSLPQNEG